MNMNKYKWYDYSFLLQAVSCWLEDSAKQHKEKGVLVRSNKTAKEMIIASNLIKRITEEEIYYKPNKLFDNKNKFPYSYCETQRKQDIDYLFDFMKKHLTGWWD